MLCHLKDPVNKLDKNNLIYNISCADCSTSYIGQTSRTLRTRVKEHKNLSKGKPDHQISYTNLEKSSAIAAHCIDKDHKIDWDNVSILMSNLNNWKERLIAESIFINSTDNTCNRKESSYPISDVWKILIHNIDQ